MSNQPSPRDAALAAAAAIDAAPTGLVAYNAHGRVAVVGQADAVDAFIAGLPEDLECTPVRLSAGTPRERLHLEGHLGDFRLTLPDDGGGEATLLAAVDTVIDLPAGGESPLLGMSLRPFGYLVGEGGRDGWPALHEQAAELVGQFHKPRFFSYDADICAHGRAGLEACRRCVDACPADAITALAEQVSVDPYLCQGGGACATVCPTGAMRYSYPDPATTLERVRALVATYRDQAGQAPVLVLGDTATLDRLDPLPAHWLPLPQEELASVGLEVWLSAIAYGADAVLLAEPAALDAGVSAALDEQVAIADALLAGMGYPEVVRRWPGDARPALAAMPARRPAGHAGLGDKRQALFMALDHLHDQAPTPAEQTALPPGAPLGQVLVDPAKCTLCMACGSVCPAKALSAGGDTPRLDFHEANCVQCGLCRQACPESAITLDARLLHDPAQRRARRVLHEEQPFCCVSCGKPFATAKVIERMLDKLAGHWMYQDEAARNRLKMCQDCRVIDMMKDSA